MKNILIPTDFSDNSWASIRCAQRLYSGQPVHFILLHVAEELYEVMTPDDQIEIHKHIGSYKRLTRFAHKAEEYIEVDQKVSFLERTGSFISMIKEVVSEKDIHLIVMSTRGNNIFDPNTLGSYTREVITRVHCNTLVVPQDVPCNYPKQMALLTDYNITLKAQAIESITTLLQPKDAHLNVVNLSNDTALTNVQLDTKQFLKDAISHLRHSFHFMINQTLDEALHFFIQVHKVDVIILLAKNLNFSQHLFFASKDQSEMHYHAKTPFLILHE